VYGLAGTVISQQVHGLWSVSIGVGGGRLRVSAIGDPGLGILCVIEISRGGVSLSAAEHGAVGFVVQFGPRVCQSCAEAFDGSRLRRGNGAPRSGVSAQSRRF